MTGRMSRQLNVFAAAAMLLAFQVVLTASPAAAGHGDTSNNPDRDNNAQAVEWWYLTNAGVEACSYGAARLDESEITISSGAGDIRCIDSDYNEYWFGLTTCEAMTGGRARARRSRRKTAPTALSGKVCA